MLDLPTSEIGNNNALQVALQVAGGRAEEGKGGTRSGADRRHYLPPVKTNHGRFSLGTRNCDLERGMGTLGSQ
jgi:hypothetical protein